MSGAHPVDLTAIVEFSPDAIVVIDRRSRIVLVNANAERMFGYARAQMLGRPLEMLMPERFRRDHGGLLGENRELGPGRRLEDSLDLVGLHADGTEFPVQIALAPMRTARGDHVIGTVRDVTEERARDQRLRSMTKRLTEAQHIAGMGSFELDADSDDMWWSAEMWQVLGVDPLLEPSRPLAYASVHPDDREEVMRLIENFEPEDDMVDFEHRILRPDGRVRWVRTVARFEERADGGRWIVGTSTDVTDLRVAFQKRHEAERYFLIGFERSPIGMAVIGLDGRFSRVNRAYCRIVGRSLNDVLHSEAGGILPRGDRHAPSVQVPFPDWLGGETEDTRTELLLPRPDGSSVWVDALVSAVSDDDGDPLFTFVQLQDISSRKDAESALEHRASHDALTGLANRALLTRHMAEALDRARRARTQVAVLFVDVDQFKLVNDSIGHAAGDALLVELARRLREVIRGGDLLARFGGDELVIVCERTTADGAAMLAERVLEMTREPYVVEGRELFVTLSVGIAVSDGFDDVATVLRNSDAAMYTAKGQGRARAIAFDETMHSQATARLDIESQLVRALERDEFTLVYQPVVAIDTGMPIGFEALLRWNSPERGLVSPAEFMPVAEQTGLIVEIGEWVLERAFTQLREWHELMPQWSRLQLGVNLSAVQLHDAGFAAMLDQVLARTGVDPSTVYLELTESVAMGDSQKAIASLEAIRATGLGLAIDDFGTGYSSLASLRQLPVQTIKIDRSFVSPLGPDDEQSRSIVRAILALSEALGLQVVAEGVETDLQADELLRLGARFAQGFLWARPLPPSEVPTWVRQRLGARVQQD